MHLIALLIIIESIKEVLQSDILSITMEKLKEETLKLEKLITSIEKCSLSTKMRILNLLSRGLNKNYDISNVQKIELQEILELAYRDLEQINRLHKQVTASSSFATRGEDFPGKTRTIMESFEEIDFSKVDIDKLKDFILEAMTITKEQIIELQKILTFEHIDLKKINELHEEITASSFFTQREKYSSRLRSIIRSFRDVDFKKINTNKFKALVLEAITKRREENKEKLKKLKISLQSMRDSIGTLFYLKQGEYT